MREVLPAARLPKIGKRIDPSTACPRMRGRPQTWRPRKL